MPITSEIKNTKELGDLLRSRREEMGVTQEQAAHLCNVGPRFIGELENGKGTTQLGKVLQVIQGYGLILTASTRSAGRRK